MHANPRTVLLPRVPFLVALGAGVVATSALLAAPPAPPAAPPAPPATAPAASTPAPPADSTPIRDPARPANIRDFSPEEDIGTADPNTNLRRLFENLGPDAIEWYQHVQTLSNPYFGGRAPGTDGMSRATDYVDWWMGHIGLAPAFAMETEASSRSAAASVPAQAPDASAPAAPSATLGSSDDWTTHRQYFDLPGGGMELKRGEAFLADAALKSGEDFVVLGCSGTGELTAPLVFVGYGIKSGRDGYSSFADDERLDGRIAVLFRYEPLDDEGQSRWSDRRFSEHASILPKLREVVDRGAAGVILVNPPGSKHGRRGLESIDNSKWGGDFKVPMVQISEEKAETLLAAADPEKRTLLQWRQLADRGEVKSVKLADGVTVRLATEVSEKKIRTCNVGGVLPGRGALKGEWLIIGAHYDHVGMGYFGTASSNRGQLHPGADDNASGTAGLLVLARRLAERFRDQADELPRRSILFLAFTAEESGLHGSRWFTRNPTVSGEKTTAMLNMDMIGRLRKETVSVSGTGTAEGFDEILAPHFAKSSLTIEKNPSGRGPSDHANFYAAGIPVLFPFTGLHDDYHSPRDKAYTVNPAGAVKVIELMEAIAVDLATRPDRLAFKNADAGSGQDRGYAPVRLGVAPAMGGEESTGVVVESVSEGTSAAEAGIQPGDVLIAWNGEEMVGPRSLMENLQKHKPGDSVQIVLLRNGERQVVTATLKAGQRRDR